MRVIATGGGTGGHVYPALSVIEALTADARWNTRPEDVLWVGSAGGMEEQIVRHAGIRFEAVSTGALRGRNPVALAGNLLSMGRGVRQARALIRRWGPQVILATGGYVSAPAVLGARRLCPVLIYLPDMQPGLAIRYLGRYARRIAVSFETVARYFPAEKVLISGYPVRAALHQADRRASRLALGLPEHERVLLVLGGSRGAHSINEAVRGTLRELLAMAHLLHISGSEDYAALDAVRGALPDALRERYHLSAYVHEGMTDLLASADLVVARAGAATLGEFPAVGLPAVLVPYPYAGQHQEQNAAYLVERGAARLVHDDEMTSRLLPTVSELLGDDRLLAKMSVACHTLAVPDAAARIASALQQLANEKGSAR